MNLVSVNPARPGLPSAAVRHEPIGRRVRVPNWLIVLAVLLLASVVAERVKAAAPAPAPVPMTLLEQYPHAHQLMSGSGVAFSLGFDRPLDHAASYFTLVAPGGHQRTIRLRLNAQPNTLYASVGRLDPGDYELRWHVRAEDGHRLFGAFPFTVGKGGRLGQPPSSGGPDASDRTTRGT